MTLAVTTGKIAVEDLQQTAAGTPFNRTRTVNGVATTQALTPITAANLVLDASTVAAYIAVGLAVVYISDALNFLLAGASLSGTALPVASASYRGKLFYVRGASGTPDTLYVCTKLGNDTYDWTLLTP